MARKLPWATATGASTPTKRKPAAKQPGREASVSPSSEENEASKPKPPAQSKLNFDTPTRRVRGSRSPSTSPIYGPPTAVPMRPGYEADDIYIMVEDELQAIAQTFTHHLHAAEYKRLKKKAREAPPRTTGMLPRLSPNAPREVKRKFEVMALQDQQKSVLSEDAEDKARDPWLGTSLAGLMGSSSQPKKPLIGSQDIQSSTRAANGFGRGEGDSPSKKTKVGALELLSLQPEPPKPKNAAVDRRSVPLIANGLPDMQKPDTETVKLPTVPQYSTTKPSTFSTQPPAATKSSGSRSKASTRPPRKKFSFDDDFDIDSLSSSVADENPKATATAKRTPKKEIKDESKKGTTRLSEIPMFLV